MYKKQTTTNKLITDQSFIRALSFLSDTNNNRAERHISHLSIIHEIILH